MDIQYECVLHAFNQRSSNHVRLKAGWLKSCMFNASKVESIKPLFAPAFQLSSLLGCVCMLSNVDSGRLGMLMQGWFEHTCLYAEPLEPTPRVRCDRIVYIYICFGIYIRNVL